MSYQVIARKWRPQSFEEITGQESITRTLQNSIRMNRLHHAFIFSGPRGCGKTTTARILAKALNCLKQVTPTPCGICDSCLEIASGGSIDVLEIDAASNTGVDNVRDVVINTVAINPARDRYKIFIIDEVHMLSISAFNALLKTLEEPPPHIIFILATTEIHKLPQTILSRCQHFEFRTIAAESILTRLRLIADAEKIAINDDALMMVAFAGQGSMRDAQSAFDQVISFAGTEISGEDVRSALGLINEQTLREFTLAIAGSDQKKLIYLTSKLAETGYDLRQFCRDLMVHFRNLVMLKTVGYDREIVSILSSEIPSYQEQASRFTSEDLVRFFHLLTSLEQEIKLSSQPKFHLEIGLIKLGQLTKLQSIEEIVFWLKALEEKITGDLATTPVKKIASPITSLTNPTVNSPVSLTPSTVSTPVSAPISAPLPKIETPIAKVTEPVKETTKLKPVNKTVENSPFPAPKTTKPQQEPSVLKLVEPSLVIEDEEVSETKLPTPDKEVEIKSDFTGDTVELLKNELEAQRKWMLLTALAQGKVEVQSNVLKIRFNEKAKIYYQTVTNKENKQALTDATKAILGKELRLDIKMESAESAALEDSEEVKQEQLRKQVMETPIVQTFLKTFKGEIVEIKQEEERKK